MYIMLSYVWSNTCILLSPIKHDQYSHITVANIWFDNQCNKKINAVGRNDDQSMSLA